MDMNALFEGSVREGFMEEMTLSCLFLFFQAEKVGYYVPGPGKRRQKKCESFTINFFKEWCEFQNGLICTPYLSERCMGHLQSKKTVSYSIRKASHA